MFKRGAIGTYEMALARIIQVHPGKDGKVRVVTVKTAKGIYRRPVIKMVPLVFQKLETVRFRPTVC